MNSFVRERIRQDTVPLLLYLITFVVMSYPFIFKMHDHLPLDNVDTHHALWQNWSVLDALIQGHDLNHTELLFYPAGLDTSLLPPRWASLPIWMPLYLIFADPLAFNLTAMIGILIKAYGMYSLCLWLFKKRIPAWVSGAFYAFAATSLQMALQQPLTGSTEWIPWFMLAYLYGLSQIKSHHAPRKVILSMILAGLLFALSAYANLKIAIFAMLLGGGYVAIFMLVNHLWRIPLFWLAMIVFGGSVIAFCSPILSTVLESGDLDSANEEGVIDRGGVDILSYAKPELKRPFNYMQSIASLRGEQLETRNIWGMSHVGFVSIAFAFMGVLYAIRVDRQVFIWVILAVIFWLLSLGLDFYYKLERIDFYYTPYRLLEDNIIFLTLKWPYRMSLVFLFPFSILIGYGLHYRLQSLELNRRQIGLLILAVVMLLYGTSIFPIPMRPAPRPAYIQALEDLPDGAVVDIPFGRHTAKYYMSIQRFTNRPMIEGMIARTPPGTYDYIDTNRVLALIRNKADYTLDDISPADWQSAFDQLWDDGFRYVILHQFVPETATRIEYPEEWVVDLFASLPNVYADDEVMIYDIDVLREEVPEALAE